MRAGIHMKGRRGRPATREKESRYRLMKAILKRVRPPKELSASGRSDRLWTTQTRLIERAEKQSTILRNAENDFVTWARHLTWTPSRIPSKALQLYRTMLLAQKRIAHLNQAHAIAKSLREIALFEKKHGRIPTPNEEQTIWRRNYVSYLHAQKEAGILARVLRSNALLEDRIKGDITRMRER